MQPNRLLAGVAFCLLFINPIYSNHVLSSCKHYQDLDGTVHPLDICTTQSTNDVIISTKTICDSKSTSLLHQIFAGSDCSDLNLRSQETLNSDQFSSVLCDGIDCAVSFRSYSNNDCNSSFQDFAFVQGIKYPQQYKCTMYNCTSVNDTKSMTISEINCSSNSSYTKNTYFDHFGNCQILPLHCGYQYVSYLSPNITDGFSDKTIQSSYTVHTTWFTQYNGNEDVSLKYDHEIGIYALPAIPIQCICLVITCLILLSLIYFFYLNKETKKWMYVTFKLFVMSSIMFNIIGIVCIIYMTFSMMEQKRVRNEGMHSVVSMECIEYYGAVIGFVGGKFSLESFFILRVYKAFQGSVFELSKIVYVFLFIWIVFVSLMWVFIFIMDDESIHFLYFVIWVLESIFIITLLYLFINRLQTLVAVETKRKATHPSVTSRPSSTRHTPSITPHHVSGDLPMPISLPKTKRSVSVEVSMPIDEEDFEKVIYMDRCVYICCMVRANIRSTKSNLASQTSSLIYLMTRCVLLSSISLITTAVFGIFLSIQTSIDIRSIYILYAMWSIDIAINSCCLYLNFKFTDIIYKKWCILCHNSCQHMLEYISASKMVHDDAVRSFSDLKKNHSNIKSSV